MDLNKEIKEAADKVIAEKLPAMVEEKVGKMLNDVLDDIFRSYSETSKAIKKKIEEKLDVNLQNFDLIDYNGLVSKTINDQLLEHVNLKPIMDLCQDAIGFVNKKTITLSEIVEMFKQSAMEGNDEAQGEISIHIEENSQYEWVEVNLDADSKVNKEDCGIRFIVSGKTGRIFSFSSGNYNSKMGKITPSKLTMLSQLEHKIFRLYSAQVNVEIDSFNFEEEWYKYD